MLLWEFLRNILRNDVMALWSTPGQSVLGHLDNFWPFVSLFLRKKWIKIEILLIPRDVHVKNKLASSAGLFNHCSLCCRCHRSFLPWFSFVVVMIFIRCCCGPLSLLSTCCFLCLFNYVWIMWAGKEKFQRTVDICCVLTLCWIIFALSVLSVFALCIQSLSVFAVFRPALSTDCCDCN